MRKWLVCSVAVGMLSLSMSDAWAKGIFVTPGARANGYGSAFYAIADDPSAVYYNPAGLAQLKGRGVEFSGWYEANNAKSNKSLGNAVVPNAANGDFPFPKIYDPAVNVLLPNAEPDEYNNKELETSAFLPFLVGYGRVKDTTIAAGAYVVGGGGGKWRDTVTDTLTMTDNISASVEATQQVFMVYNVSAARQVTPELSIGLGIDYITYDDKLEVRKSLTRGTGSVLPADYSFYTKDTSNGSGVQVNAGALYSVTDNVSAGLVFRSGAALQIKGTTRFALSGLAALGMGDQDRSSDYDQSFSYPMSYGLGVAYDPSKKWTLALGVEQTNYSTMRQDKTYKNPVPGVFVNSGGSLGWKDTTQLRMGAEYRATEKLSAYGGFQTDPTPYSRDNVTLLSSNQYDFVYYYLGAGYDFGYGLNGKLIYCYGVSEKLEKGGRTYEFPLVNMARVSIGYAF